MAMWFGDVIVQSMENTVDRIQKKSKDFDMFKEKSDIIAEYSSVSPGIAWWLGDLVDIMDKYLKNQGVVDNLERFTHIKQVLGDVLVVGNSQIWSSFVKSSYIFTDKLDKLVQKTSSPNIEDQYHDAWQVSGSREKWSRQNVLKKLQVFGNRVLALGAEYQKDVNPEGWKDFLVSPEIQTLMQSEVFADKLDFGDKDTEGLTQSQSVYLRFRFAVQMKAKTIEESGEMLSEDEQEEIGVLVEEFNSFSKKTLGLDDSFLLSFDYGGMRMRRAAGVESGEGVVDEGSVTMKELWDGDVAAEFVLGSWDKKIQSYLNNSTENTIDVGASFSDKELRSHIGTLFAKDIQEDIDNILEINGDLLIEYGKKNGDEGFFEGCLTQSQHLNFDKDGEIDFDGISEEYHEVLGQLVVPLKDKYFSEDKKGKCEHVKNTMQLGVDMVVRSEALGSVMKKLSSYFASIGEMFTLDNDQVSYDPETGELSLIGRVGKVLTGFWANLKTGEIFGSDGFNRRKKREQGQSKYRVNDNTDEEKISIASGDSISRNSREQLPINAPLLTDYEKTIASKIQDIIPDVLNNWWEKDIFDVKTVREKVSEKTSNIDVGTVMETMDMTHLVLSHSIRKSILTDKLVEKIPKLFLGRADSVIEEDEEKTSFEIFEFFDETMDFLAPNELIPKFYDLMEKFYALCDHDKVKNYDPTNEEHEYQPFADAFATNFYTGRDKVTKKGQNFLSFLDSVSSSQKTLDIGLMNDVLGFVEDELEQSIVDPTLPEETISNYDSRFMKFLELASWSIGLVDADLDDELKQI